MNNVIDMLDFKRKRNGSDDAFLSREAFQEFLGPELNAFSIALAEAQEAASEFLAMELCRTCSQLKQGCTCFVAEELSVKKGSS